MKLIEHIAHHAGFTKEDIDNYNCFVTCQLTPFGDSSDDTLFACVRYVNPQNDIDWGYDMFVLHDTNQPSHIFWSIECVYSTHHDCFGKKSLVN